MFGNLKLQNLMSPRQPHRHQEHRLRQAERCMRRGRLRQAIAWYQELVADNPLDLVSLNRIGDLMVRTRQLPEALGIFLRVARRYAEDGFLAKSIAIYRKVLRFDPCQQEARRRLRDLYRQRDLPVPLL